MNILFLPSWYPNKAYKTEGNFIQRHAIAFSQQHTLHVFFMKALPSIKSSHVQQNKVNENLTETILYYPQSSLFFLGKIINFFRMIRAIRQITHLILLQSKSNNYHILHTHVLSIKTILLAILLHRKLHIPWIHTEHWSKFLVENKHKRNPIDLILLKIANKRVDLFLPVSEYLKKSMQILGIKKPMRVLYNAVDPSLFHPPHHHIPFSPFRYIHISTLDEEAKNVSGILSAIKQLQKKNIPFHFTFLSDGNIDQLSKQIEQMKINKKDITVVGEKSIEEVAGILQQHHCLILFSNYENMPCVIAEALCCGIPVIATSVGGIPEIVHDQNGILIPPRDIPQLTNALIRIMKNYSAYNSHFISREAQKFHYISITNQYTQIIHKIVTKQ